jgi:AcrR family transcriptional regulator
VLPPKFHLFLAELLKAAIAVIAEMGYAEASLRKVA